MSFELPAAGLPGIFERKEFSFHLYSLANPAAGRGLPSRCIFMTRHETESSLLIDLIPCLNPRGIKKMKDMMPWRTGITPNGAKSSTFCFYTAKNCFPRTKKGGDKICPPTFCDFKRIALPPGIVGHSIQLMPIGLIPVGNLSVHRRGPGPPTGLVGMLWEVLDDRFL
jgi:hypothetical protein